MSSINNGYKSLLNNFETNFIQSIPEGIRFDVIARLQNPAHKGIGFTNNEVIKVVRNTFSHGIKKQLSLDKLQTQLNDNLALCAASSRGQSNRPAVQKALEIISKMFTLPLDNFPEDIKITIFNNKIFSKLDINNLRLVSKEFCRIIDTYPPHIKILCKKSGLLARKFGSLEIAQNNFENVGWYRNSRYVLLNLSKSLKKYAETGDINQQIEAERSFAHGGSLQPNTILETFQNALSEECYGGFQQTIQQANKDIQNSINKEKNLEFVNFAPQIIEFIKTLALDNFSQNL